AIRVRKWLTNRIRGFVQLGKGQLHMGRSGRGQGYCSGGGEVHRKGWDPLLLGGLFFSSPISSIQEANVLTRLRSSKVMSGLASLMFCFNVKTLKDGHNADLEMQDATISIFDAPFFTRSVCRKSPPRRTDLPPNKEDGLLTISLRLLSSASKYRQSFIWASSQIIRSVSANNFPS
nr:hypothetical protein [Tanacetum cinerariifolium]